jgi:2-hydroxychromene-2-carboxylate isomerase
MTPIEFCFDYASPWSYLASEILDRQLPGVPVTHVPIYLRGFPQFATGIPYDAPRLQYLVADLRRCTEHWGVPLQVPPGFPLNGLYALRGALWVQAHARERFAAYHQAAFRAAWRDALEVSRKEVVIGVAAGIGLDAAAFAAGIDAPELKDRLRAQTDAARARGAFGVPTFFVGAELFFGHDRMDYVRRAVAAVATVA